MRQIPVLIWLVMATTLCPDTTWAQERGIDPSHQTAPTLTGGTSTGLFQTYSSRTLPAGQYNFGIFWHNFDRDPGDLDINRIPVNLTYGVTNTIEVFLNINFFQQVTTGQPFLLSGSVFNQRRILEGGPGADPLVAFGPPQPGTGDDGAAFFPGTGNLFGSLLPPVGGFIEPINGRLFVPFDRAGYSNDFPFFPFADGAGPRASSNGLGDITIGIKANVTDPDQSFSIGTVALLEIPSARKYDALADGRGAGAVDWGTVLIFSQQAFEERVRVHQNIGYMFTGSVKRSGLTILDRRDELILNVGLEFALWDEVVYTAELNNIVYVGGGTPNLNPVNPMDLRLGARFFLFDGRFQIGGAWQRFLNNADTRRLVQLDPTTQRTSPVIIEPGDANGFVFNIGYGKRPQRLPPPPPNRPPTINLEPGATTVTDGDSVPLAARAADPDNDVLIFTWSTTAGRITGSGPNVRLETKGANPNAGDPPTQVTVSLTVDDGRGGFDTASITVTVTSPPPPPPSNRSPVIDAINYAVIGRPQIEGQITDGELVQIQANARDPDGDPLSFNWRTSAGQLTGTGAEVRLDTTNVTAGPGAEAVLITLNLTLDDHRGGTVSAAATVTVSSVEKPEPERLQPDLLFPRHSARVNNIHKAFLDDIVLRLQHDPAALILIDGHRDRGESRQLAQRRADNVKRYLQREKGIDADRIVIRAFGADRPHPGGEGKKNQRVELWIVPNGADLPQ